MASPEQAYLMQTPRMGGLISPATQLLGIHMTLIILFFFIRSARFPSGESHHSVWRGNDPQPRLPTHLSQEYHVSLETSGDQQHEDPAHLWWEIWSGGPRRWNMQVRPCMWKIYCIAGNAVTRNVQKRLHLSPQIKHFTLNKNPNLQSEALVHSLSFAYMTSSHQMGGFPTWHVGLR